MKNPRILTFLPVILLILLGACSARPIPQNTAFLVIRPSAAPTLSLPTPTMAVTATALQPLAEDETCGLQPVLVPTMPAVVPAPNQLDETTGLHMTGIVQKIDLASFRLKVSGKVDRPL